MAANPFFYPIVRDNSHAIESAIEEALSCDLLILSGGVSMGKYDFVEQALLNLHAEFFFTGVRMQPGRPVVFGRLPAGDGLPLFLWTPRQPRLHHGHLRALRGAAYRRARRTSPREHWTPFVEAHLARDLQAKPGLTRFLPARLESDTTTASFIPSPGKAPAIRPPHRRQTVFWSCQRRPKSLSAR